MARRSLPLAGLILSAVVVVLRWTPAGQAPQSRWTIAYTHITQDINRDGFHPSYDIYAVNTDGTGVRALTSDGNSHSPSWSANGRQILFVQDGRTQRVNPFRQAHLPFGLYAMSNDGKDVHMIFGLGTEAYFPNRASWSPDGKLIAAGYLQLPGGRPNVYLMSASSQTELHVLLPEAFGPSWSPDGKKLAVAREGIIQVLKADGSGVVSLTDSLLSAGYPSWSPDGRQIAFAATQKDTPSSLWGIYVMTNDGSNERRLTTDPHWSCQFPSWSPDGSEIAFSCMSRCDFIAPSVGLARGSANISSIPDCAQRIFIVSVNSPPVKLTPLINENAEMPSFAPPN